MIHYEFPTPEIAIQHWDELYSFLQKAIKYSNGELNEDSIKTQTSAGNLLLTAIYDDTTLVSVIAFELLIFTSGKRVINIQLAGGSDMVNWIEKMDDISQSIARAKDCNEIYIVGRPGWQRKLKQYGFEPIHTVLHKEVTQ